MAVVKYVGYYSKPFMKPKRLSSLAAVNKMDYVCDAINRAGYDVQIISPSWVTESDSTLWHGQQTIDLSDRIRVTVCPSLHGRSNLSRSLNIIGSLIWLCIYLLFHTKKNEKVLAYHSPLLSLPLRIVWFYRIWWLREGELRHN